MHNEILYEIQKVLERIATALEEANELTKMEMEVEPPSNIEIPQIPVQYPGGRNGR